MHVVLFRHGHKEFSMDEDPGLNLKGLAQADRLVEVIEAGEVPRATHAWFSEKKRTRQTLEKFIAHHRPETKKASELNYRDNEENLHDFRNRVAHFFSRLVKTAHPDQVHYVCTHYDWIDEAMTLIESAQNLTGFEYASWPPGQFLLFKVDGSCFRVLGKGVL